MAHSEKNRSSGDIVFDTSSGISEEDQKEILAKIDMVARENRIQAPKGEQLSRAKHKGYAFPLFVNIGALVLLVSVFFILSAAHRSSETDIRGAKAAQLSFEGRLLQELQRETAALLREKEQQIDSVLARLSDIDGERGRLRSGMEAKIEAREKELRGRLSEEVQAERERLTRDGVSGAAFDERLRSFEAEKTVLLLDELNAFRHGADAERDALEKNLAALGRQFQGTLETLRAERTQILENSRIKETELREQLAAKMKNEASQGGRADLESAREELGRLAENKERSTLIEGQIDGYLYAIARHIQADRLGEASQSIKVMRDFLNEPSLQRFPNIESRRDIYLITLSSLSSLVDKNLNNQREARSISEILQNGAQVLPAPGIEPGWQEAAREFTSAETLVAAGKYEEALGHYAQALAFLPGGGAQANLIRDSLIRAASQNGEKPAAAESQEPQNDPAAARLLREAEGQLAEGQYRAAASSFVSVVDRYPRSTQVRAALRGIQQAVDAQSAAAAEAGASSAASYETTLQTLREQNSSLAQTLETLRKTHQIDLKTQEVRLRNELAGASAANAAGASGAAALQAQIAELKRAHGVELGEQEKRIHAERDASVTAAEAKYKRLQSLYEEYGKKEDAALKGGDARLPEARGFLNDFLNSNELKAVFPEFAERMKRHLK